VFLFLSHLCFLFFFFGSLSRVKIFFYFINTKIFVDAVIIIFIIWSWNKILKHSNGVLAFFPRFLVPGKWVTILWPRVRNMGVIGNVDHLVPSFPKKNSLHTEFQLSSSLDESICCSELWLPCETLSNELSLDPLQTKSPSGSLDRAEIKLSVLFYHTSRSNEIITRAQTIFMESARPYTPVNNW